MTHIIRRTDLVLGLEGTALLRHALDRGDAFAADRVAALRRLLDQRDQDDSESVAVAELDVGEGYEAWAPRYDAMSNALIQAEAPLIAAAVRDLAPGRALDAACGTGRHAAALAALGHDVVGVDRSPAMLAVARQKLPEGTFHTGTLTDIPLPDASVDLAVCALAMTHLAELGPAVRELARVVRPGGRVVISDGHPTGIYLYGQALFLVDDGWAFIRNHIHLHSSYMDAFADAGLGVLRCMEAPMPAGFRGGRMFAGADEAASSIWGDLPAVLVWNLCRTPAPVVSDGL